MADDGSAFASHDEVEQLREEVRRLKQQTHNGNGHNGGQEDQEPEKKEEEAKEPEKKPHPVRKFLIAGALLIVALSGLLWWLHARQFESTDDAIVDGHISGVAARISGTVTGVYL